jgi:hypothetical protein
VILRAIWQYLTVEKVKSVHLHHLSNFQIKQSMNM